jgi:hypothetical protein
MRFLASFAVVTTLALGVAARSQGAVARSPSIATVCHYFEALNRNDFGSALSLTAGAAEARTQQMLGKLKHEADKADARVELHVRKLAVAERAPTHGAVPVDVVFDIDVVGKRWFFSRVARKLAGTARFLVEPAPTSAPRIVAINGALQ